MKGQQDAFKSLKVDFVSSETLALYGPERETVLSADSNSYGLVAVLLRWQNNGKLQSVTFASRSLKEMLCREWKWSPGDYSQSWRLVGQSIRYVAASRHRLQSTGVPFLIQADDELPIWIQCFKMLFTRNCFNIVYISGRAVHSWCPVKIALGNS